MTNKILVTGHKGFIGRNLFKSIIQSVTADGDFANDGKNHPSWAIVGLEMDDYFTPDHTQSWQNRLNQYLFDNSPSVVFHVGAIADTLNTDVNFMMERNYEASRIISDWCSFNNVPLIYSSSAACYGVGHGDSLPMNIYAWSKYVAEQYIIQNGGIALRYFNVYGPYEEHKGIMASVAYQMYMKNLNGEKIKLFPDKPKRDFVHVDDVARANLFAFTHYNDLYGKVYDVGTGTPHEFEKIMELLKIEYTYHDKSVIPEGYQFYTSSDPYKWMPSWQPIYDLENGIDHYKAYLNRELASGNYKRYLREQYKYGG